MKIPNFSQRKTIVLLFCLIHFIPDSSAQSVETIRMARASIDSLDVALSSGCLQKAAQFLKTSECWLDGIRDEPLLAARFFRLRSYFHTQHHQGAAALRDAHRMKVALQKVSVLPFRWTLIAQLTLGDAHLYSEHYDAAIAAYREGIDCWEKAGKKPDKAVVMLYNNLGATCEYQYAYDSAGQWYQKALEFQETHFPEEGRQRSRILYNLGHIFLWKGQLDSAFSAYQTALQSLPEDSTSVFKAEIEHAIGTVFQEQCHWKAAIRCYRKSLDMLDELLGQEHPRKSIPLSNLGVCLLQSEGVSPEALQWLQKAEDQYLNTGAFFELHNLYLHLSQAYLQVYDKTGRHLKEARWYAEAAVDLAEKQWGRNSAPWAEAQKFLGDFWKASEDLMRAAAHWRKAWSWYKNHPEAYPRHWVQLQLSLVQAEWLPAHHLSNALRACFFPGREGLLSQLRYPVEWSAIIQWQIRQTKSPQQLRVLLETALQGGAWLLQTRQSLTDQFRMQEQIQSLFGEAVSKAYTQWTKTSDLYWQAILWKCSGWMGTCLQNNPKGNGLTQHLKTSFPSTPISSERKKRRLIKEWKQWQNSLPPGRLWVELLPVGAGQALLLWIDRDLFQCRRIDLPPSCEERWADWQWQHVPSAGRNEQTGFCRQLVTPLLPSWLHCEDLVFLPYGKWSNFPLDLLLESILPGTLKDRTFCLAIRRYPSASSPDWKIPLQVWAPIPHFRDTLSALPWAEAEVEALQERWMAEVYQGPDCRLETFAHLGPKAGILHLAGHAVFRGAEVVLPFHGDQGGICFLKGEHLDSLSLNARLVVLHTCFSGRGQGQYPYLSGGLAQSFLLSGAKGVLATRWAVSDRAGHLFMKRFYEHLLDHRCSPARALAHTRHEFQEHPDIALADPAVWGAYYLLGEVHQPFGATPKTLQYGQMMSSVLLLGVALGLYVMGCTFFKNSKGRLTSACITDS